MSYDYYVGFFKAKIGSLLDSDGKQLIEVFDYGNDDNTQYPYLNITCGPTTGAPYTNREVKRVYSFNLRLYMSLSDAVLGSQKGESLFRNALDSIINLFDTYNSWHSPNPDLIKLTKALPQIKYKAGAPVRFADITIEVIILNS